MDECLDVYHSCVPSKRKYLFDSVVVGDLNTLCTIQTVIVLSESWPSWVYSLGGIFGNIKLCVSCHELIKLKNLWFDQSIIWWNWNSWINHGRDECEKDAEVLFCVQGSLEFVYNVFKKITEFKWEASVVMVVDAMDMTEDFDFKDRRLESRYVSHSTCGGTTKDKWQVMIIHNGIDWILHCKEDNTRQFGSGIKRCLKDVIDMKQSGKTVTTYLILTTCVQYLFYYSEEAVVGLYCEGTNCV